MNLTQYFRVVTQVLFAKNGGAISIQGFTGRIRYESTYFYLPRIYANDGFNVSIQIHNGNYCETENGYRAFGDNFIDVEFGFPSQNEELMKPYAEGFNYGGYDDDGNETPFILEEFDITGTVGKIPVSVMEEVFAKHGGIDWEKSSKFQ